MVAICPQIQDLEQFVVGQLPEARAMMLEAHLAECSRCLKTLDTLKTSDRLIETVRSGVKAPPVVSESGELIENLMERLFRQSHSECSDLATEPDGGTGQQTGDFQEGSGSSVDPELHDFLSPAERPGDLGRLGSYRVLKVLGAGGMGVVFLAEDPQLKRLVALKAMKPALAASKSARIRFLKEAQATAAIKHPHVVTIHQVAEDRGIPFLAMELLEGETLASRLRRDGRLPIPEALAIARQTAKGLAAAHDKGLVHRDIKPGNIWLETNDERRMMNDERKSNAGRSSLIIHHSSFPRVKILDFGLARIMGDDAHLTRTGGLVGTPAYMSPEQGRGEPVDHRCDLFSLGAVCYRMITGKPPFHGKDTMSVLQSLANDHPATPHQLDPGVPHGLSNLVMRLLAKNIPDRPASALAVVHELEKLEVDRPGKNQPGAPAAVFPVAIKTAAVASSAPPSSGQKAAASSPRRRFPWKAAAAVLAAVLGVAVILFAPTLIRFAGNTGELFIEIDDPDIEVVIRQDKVVLVDRSKDRKFELAPGEGQVEVIDPDSGARLLTKSFTLERGGKVRVSVARELAQARASLKKKDLPGAENLPRDKPFVLIRGNGGKQEEFQHLTGALATLQNGDVIEVHGNGPFQVGSVSLDGKGLTLKAAPGYRPQFVPSEEDVQYWFVINRGALHVEGCDFRVPPGYLRTIFLSSGEACEIRNCRFLGHFNLINSQGPKVRVADCLISTKSGGLVHCPAPKTHLELENNIMRTFYASAITIGNGVHVRLYKNTMITSHACFALGSYGMDIGKGVTIEATENLFQVGALIGSARGSVKDLKEGQTWRGRNNLYTVLPNWTRFVEVASPKPAQHFPNLAAWNDFWGKKEEGSLEEKEVPHPAHIRDAAVFQWAVLSRADNDAAIRYAKEVTTSMRQRYGLKELGPDWDLVGPGEPYLRALAAAGKPVAKEKLRPPAPETGPMVLVRKDKALRGYLSLQEAFAAAESGDAIEIHGDGPFPGGILHRGPRPLTIRTAPGYRPTITTPIDDRSDKPSQLIIEGLLFQNFPFGYSPAIRRLINCSFTGGFVVVGDFKADAGPKAEIVNCLISGPVLAPQVPGHKLAVRNSLVESFRFGGKESDDGQGQLELDRCLVWAAGYAPWSANGYAFVHVSSGGKGQLNVKVRRTIFETGIGLFHSYHGYMRVASWQGSQNVYRTGNRPWADSWAADGDPKQRLSLDKLKKEWNSDRDSFEMDPLDYDPLQWRLLPSSSGYQALPGGKDIGADTSRIAITK